MSDCTPTFLFHDPDEGLKLPPIWIFPNGIRGFTTSVKKPFLLPLFTISRCELLRGNNFLTSQRMGLCACLTTDLEVVCSYHVLFPSLFPTVDFSRYRRGMMKYNSLINFMIFHILDQVGIWWNEVSQIRLFFHTYFPSIRHCWYSIWDTDRYLHSLIYIS